MEQQASFLEERANRHRDVASDVHAKMEGVLQVGLFVSSGQRRRVADRDGASQE